MCANVIRKRTPVVHSYSHFYAETKASTTPCKQYDNSQFTPPPPLGSTHTSSANAKKITHCDLINDCFCVSAYLESLIILCARANFYCGLRTYSNTPLTFVCLVGGEWDLEHTERRGDGDRGRTDRGASRPTP